MHASLRCGTLILTLPLLSPGVATQQGDVWTEMDTQTDPQGRFGHAMTYDEQRQFVVMFGGVGADGRPRNDTWEFDGQDWTQATPTHRPPARIGHTLTYVPGAGGSVLLGGLDGNQIFGDIWLWNGTDWAQVPVAQGPVAALARVDGIAGCVSPDKMFTHGGFSRESGNEVVHGGVLEISFDPTANPVSANLQPVQGSFPPRFGHTGVLYDGNLVLIGGADDFHNRQPVDVVAANLNSRQVQELPGFDEVQRSYAATVADPARGRLHVIGGNPQRRTQPNSSALVRFPATAAAAQESGDSGMLVMQRLVTKPAQPNDLVGSRAATMPDGRAILFGGQTPAFQAVGRTWIFDPQGRAQSVVPLQRGCEDTPLTIYVDAPPQLQKDFVARGSSLTEAPAGYGLLWGFQKDSFGNIPLPANLGFLGMPGCVLEQDIFLVQVAQNGGFVFTVPIPNDPSLPGTRFYNTVVQFVPGFNPAGLLASRAACSIVGR